MKPSLLVLAAAIAFVDANPALSLCKGKYLYKKDNVAECAICGICPAGKDLKELEQMGAIQRECKDKASEPLGQRDQFAWCFLSGSTLPACQAWDDPNGKVKCDQGKHQMFVVYRPCWLECTTGFHPNASHGVECTDNLQWNDTRPKCIPDGKIPAEEIPPPADDAPNRPVVADPSTWLIVLGVLAVITSVVSVVVLFMCWRKKLCLKRGKKEIPGVSWGCTVEVEVQPCISRNSSCFAVPPGAALSVEARCSCRGQRHQVRHLMVVSLAAPPKLFGHFLSKGSSSPRVLLPPSPRGAQFSWIAQVVDRRSRVKEAREGNFSIQVDDSPRAAAAAEDPEGNDKQHLLDEGDAAQNILGSQDMNNSDPTKCEDVDGMLAMKKLLEDKSTMELICRYLDTEQRQGVSSWHHLATQLLDFQQQDLSFLEYHLKGKLYEGPTSHVMRLLYQQGVSISPFLQCLGQCRNSDHLVARITGFLRGLPQTRPPATLAFPELIQEFDRR